MRLTRFRMGGLNMANPPLSALQNTRLPSRRSPPRDLVDPTATGKRHIKLLRIASLDKEVQDNTVPSPG